MTIKKKKKREREFDRQKSYIVSVQQQKKNNY